MIARLGFLVAFAGAVFVNDVQCSFGISIDNEFVAAEWDENSHQLTVTHRPSGKIFVQNVVFPFDATDARLVTVQHAKFGRGQAIRVLRPDRWTYQVQVFPGLPFVLVSGELINSNPTTIQKNHIPFASLEIDWGVPPTDLTTFGTGGLFDATANPGSYAWLAVVEPKARNGAVLGWITHGRASGVLFSRVNDERILVDARLDYGRLTIKPGDSSSLETLAIGFFEDARLGLESWADIVAKVHDVRLPSQPTGYCTWYSNPHGGASDEQHLSKLAAFAAKELAPEGFSFVQIDDKWQSGESTNGPRRNFTTHDPKGPYPNGMRAIAAELQSLGLTPGIWFMPFAGTYYDPFFADHQDWFVKTADGQPYETKWGGTCLDMTQPGARAHLQSVVERIANDWGYRYFKVDGLWTGSGTPLRYVNSGYVDDGIGDAVFHDPTKTNIEVFRSALELLRRAAGTDVFILGCNAPQNMRSYGASMGLLDAMRIGPDNGPKWKQLLVGPRFGSRHYFLHGRVWYNDPDPVYVRKSMPLNHSQLICSWVAVSGQLNVSSDWLPGLPKDRLDILKRTMPSHGLHARPVDLFENDPPRIWSLVDDRHRPYRYIVGLFNWDDQPRQISCPLSDLDLDEESTCCAYDFWNDEFIEGINSPLSIRLPGQSCRILSMRPVANRPQLLSTSRHATQGIIDVLEENWSESDRKLYGKSQQLGPDEFELRIVVPSSTWNVKSVTCADASGNPLHSTFDQDADLARIRIQPPESGWLSWSVSF